MYSHDSPACSFHVYYTYFSLSTIAVQHYFGMYIVGDSASITCTIRNATRTEWQHNGSVVHSGTGSQLTIQFSVNDSIHYNLYVCRGHNGVSILNSLNVTMIANGMWLAYHNFWVTQYNFVLVSISLAHDNITTWLHCYIFGQERSFVVQWRSHAGARWGTCPSN